MFQLYHTGGQGGDEEEKPSKMCCSTNCIAFILSPTGKSHQAAAEDSRTSVANCTKPNGEIMED